MSDPRTTAQTDRLAATYLEPGLNIGTPRAPSFKRRPVLFALVLLSYVAFVAMLIVYAVRLRQGR